MKRNLKQLIFTTLNTDGPLLALLGAGQHVFRQYPRTTHPDFPIVTYGIDAEDRNDLGCDQHCNCGAVFTVQFDIWTDNDTTTLSDQVEQRIWELFHQQYLTDGVIETRFIYKKADTYLYEAEDRVHHDINLYDFTVTTV